MTAARGKWFRSVTSIDRTDTVPSTNAAFRKNQSARIVQISLALSLASGRVVRVARPLRPDEAIRPEDRDHCGAGRLFDAHAVQAGMPRQGRLFGHGIRPTEPMRAA
ncbi:hypothetical protein SPHINGO391_350379 [Sphingomonas aurantiaca]|uniref:Uncharacterized protein n=1 Tax=Sphingomonas aurantiaca TaxID=185949 RepID=A0A5E7YCX1_9SPHN|nr:hypothetical protein SPHINGO391_350379 [Sphingomonas aurantiaca]